MKAQRPKHCECTHSRTALTDLHTWCKKNSKSEPHYIMTASHDHYEWQRHYDTRLWKTKINVPTFQSHYNLYLILIIHYDQQRHYDTRLWKNRINVQMFHIHFNLYHELHIYTEYIYLYTIQYTVIHIHIKI